MSAVSSCRANSCWASRPALVSGLSAAAMMADNPPTVPGYFRPISRHRLARRSFVAWLIGFPVDCHSARTAEYSRMSGG